MSRLLLFPQNTKPHRIPISGAELQDIDLVINSVELIFNLALSALMGQLENLRENLPMDDAKFLDTESVYAQIRDLRSETLGRLEILAERS
jgi:hypothetical protein